MVHQHQTQHNCIYKFNLVINKNKIIKPLYSRAPTAIFANYFSIYWRLYWCLCARERALACCCCRLFFCYLRCFLGLNFLCISNYLMDFNIHFFADPLLLLQFGHRRCHALFFCHFKLIEHKTFLFLVKSILTVVKHAYIFHIKCACHMILSPVVAIVVVIVVIIIIQIRFGFIWFSASDNVCECLDHQISSRTRKHRKWCKINSTQTHTHTHTRAHTEKSVLTDFFL